MTDDLDPLRDASDAVLLQASAYVDGVLTAVERATAEGSPQVMALVAQMTTARTALASASVAVDSRHRDGAIAAALALHRSHPVDADARMRTGGGRVLELRRSRRWLGSLAAAALVAVVGIGVASLVASDGDEPATSDSFSIEAASASTQLADTGATSDGDQRSGGVDEINAPASIADDATAQPGGGDPSGALPAALPTPDLATESDLRDFVRARAAGSPGSVATSAAADSGVCGYDGADVIGSATYLGGPSLVVVDGDEVVALDPETCVEQLRAHAP